MKNIPHFDQSDFKVALNCAPYYHCVQVACKDEVIAVGDTKNLKQAPLYFDKKEWSVFIKGVKNGEFDF